MKKNFVKPHKISTHSDHSDNCYFHFFYQLSDSRLSWNFCEVSRNSFSNRFWKFQLSILKNKKVLFLKNIFFKPLSISKQKSFVYHPNFRWRFWVYPPCFKAKNKPESGLIKNGDPLSYCLACKTSIWIFFRNLAAKILLFQTFVDITYFSNHC